eukprot:SAG31_NODE_4039_length_3643_cov_51.767212_5_plen_84_part_00
MYVDACLLVCREASFQQAFADDDADVVDITPQWDEITHCGWTGPRGTLRCGVDSLNLLDGCLARLSVWPDGVCGRNNAVEGTR